ncbi:MAG TPA: hypothetical protein VIV12_03020, partial [Streptosporangiaceae bacterium]
RGAGAGPGGAGASGTDSPGGAGGPGDADSGADGTASATGAGVGATGSTASASASQRSGRGSDLPRLPPVRLAPREELASAARVAPLLRAARELARWAAAGHGTGPDGRLLSAEEAAAIGELELTAAELQAAWLVATGTAMLRIADGQALPGDRLDVLVNGGTDEVLTVWDRALTVMLAAEDLDGMATALYTVGGPLKMDALFEAYVAAAGSREHRPDEVPGGHPGHGADRAAGLSSALEALADLGVVELGTDEAAGGLTVTLSRLGVWGVHRHLRSQGWHVPVLGGGARGDATALLATLASCDVEDGEAEIAAWLAARTPEQAADELIDAARRGTPGLRGAGFAVLDRLGKDAVPAVRAALGDPAVRAHAAVWLHEHGEEASLEPRDRAWLLVDLGAGLLEEADPRDVVAELLPDLPPKAQADLVAGLWEVDHPAVTDLLTTLSEHHRDPAVARAARKAAFKARSPSAGASRRPSRPVGDSIDL